MRHLKKIRETHVGPIGFHWFHEFFLRCLTFEFFFFTNADVVIIKLETSKNGDKLKSKISH